MFVLVFSMFAFSVFSQGFGVRVGLNSANVTLNEDPQEGLDLGSVIGFQVGVDYEMVLSESLFFNPAVMYSTKGYKVSGSFFEQTFEATSSFNYIDIPLDFVYKMDMGVMKVGVFAGPYLGYFLGGKVTSSFGGEEKSDDLDTDGFNSLDYGLDFGAALYFNKISIRASYGLGLANLAKDAKDDESIKNKVISLTAGYRF